VSGTSISFGTAVVFESGQSNYIAATFDTANSKVVIAYQNASNSNYGTAVVGTVSGTSISFGSSVVFQTNACTFISTAFDSTAGKVVVAYNSNDGGLHRGKSKVGTVSGTSISFGSLAEFEGGQVASTSCAFDSANDKVVVAYYDTTNSNYGTAAVGTVSGTSISFGTPVVFEAASLVPPIGYSVSIVFDSTANKVVIAFRDNGNSGYGTAIVGTVSGTSISFGTAVVFENANIYDPVAVFDSTAGKVVIAYRDTGNSSYGTIIVGTVSGTSISFGTAVTFNTINTADICATFDSSNNRVVFPYRNTVSGGGDSVVFRNAYTDINLTAENYIGTAATGAADTQRAKINLKGAVDENQSGLTAGQSYYVQTDGTLGTTPDDPSVFAGTAVAANKLIVKG
jgi:hypothetical protein